MKKILTILVPVYNVQKYLKRCLDSILIDEVLEDIEVIAVNDGSKDDSLLILKEYQKKYPETLVVVDKENAGHGSTINKGIEIATGKYFRVLDSDDWFQCLDFIKFVSKLKKETADLVVTNYRQEHIYSSDSIFLPYKNLEEDKIYDFDKFDLNILNGEYFVMATSTYKTSILRESHLKMIEKTFYVDMQYNVVPISLVKTFAYYNLDIYRYFIGRKDQSMNLQSFVRNKSHHETVMKFLINHYVTNKNSFSKNKQQYIFMIVKYMLNTHYMIYCSYDKKHHQACKEIKKFDKYLLATSEEIYKSLNDISYIRVNRKTKFIFVYFNGNILLKMLKVGRKIVK